jgi:hypothetical protein
MKPANGSPLIWCGLLLFACANAAFAQAPALPVIIEDGEENPIFIPGGAESYGKVFENVLHVLISNGFEIQPQDTNRYSGHIEAIPRIAPGLFLWVKPGTPSFRERLLATLQTYRHRVFVDIDPAQNGGYFVKVTALKELEGLARPTRATAGAAIFRNDNNVERVYEVIDATYFDPHWIPKGRDTLLEQSLINNLKKCM